MKSLFKPLLIAGLLATAGFAAFSQAPGAGGYGAMMGAGGPMHEGMRHERMGKMDPARMQARMERCQADLKAQLKLTPAQEGAWTSYTEAMKPPADLAARRAEHAELLKLPTPERIDKMKALRNQHMGEMSTAMDKRGEATKAFYATLTPEQQKTFDAQAMRHRGHQGWKGRHMDGKGPAQLKS